MTIKAKFLFMFAATFAVTPAFADSPFDGTWRMDPASAKLSDKPVVLAIKDGVFACSSCVYLYSVAADGNLHPVAGSPYADQISVRIVDANTIESVQMLKGRLRNRATSRVSADGRTMTREAVLGTNTDATRAATTTWTRVSAQPVGAHAISGSWRETRISGMSDNARSFVIATGGDRFTITFPSGETITAVSGGLFVPVGNDATGTMSAIRREGARTFVDTEARGGKTIAVDRYTVSANGKTMIMDGEDKERGTREQLTYIKQ